MPFNIPAPRIARLGRTEVHPAGQIGTDGQRRSRQTEALHARIVQHANLSM